MVRNAKSRGTAPEQFEALYLEHHAFVGRCLVRWGLAPAGLDDARQDVFLTAYRRMHTVENESSMRAWLAGISRRIAWRHRRTRQRHERRVDALATLRPEVSSLDDWVRTREAQAVLDAFVDALDPPRREAFVLCELEGLSAREAADATGVNPATLYSRLRVARSSFVSMCASLQQDGIEVQPDQAAAIHRHAQPEDSRAAMRGWMLLTPKLASAVASTALIAKPMFIAALAIGGVAVSSAVVLSRPGFSSPISATVAVAPATAALARPTEAGPPVSSALEIVELAADDDVKAAATRPPPKPSPALRPVRNVEPADDLAAQVELLGAAEAHLGRGASKLALAAATSYLASWPKGPLAQDAVRVAVRARCAAGEFESAAALVRIHLPSVDAQAWVERRCQKNESGVMNRDAPGD